MKNMFVLDENIIICAQTGRNERGEDDTSALELIRDIEAHCHHIALDYELYQKYKKKYDWLRRQRISMTPISIPRLVDSMFVNPEKGYFVQDVLALEKSEGIHRKDIGLVQLAASVKGILVTTDDDLIEALDELDIKSSYDMRVLRPEAAVESAGPGDP